MDATTQQQLQQKLLDEQARLTALVERTAKHLYRREEPYSADFAEQAIEVSNNEVVEHLDQDARLELVQIGKALSKFEDGSYGVCETCDEPINEQRLQVIPYTPFCVNCA
ncbi:MAG: TraR/DksA C4-type zinc finger protein [Porticoccaceae bacterium]|nr:TraR/DksA C4-type zinc finger protein [Porticoccaceae bacterium]